MTTHAKGTFTRSKVDDDRREIVGETAIALSQTPEGVPYHHVRKEGQRGMGRLRRAHERHRQSGIVEDCVDPIINEARLKLLQLCCRSAREDAHRELGVVTCETLARIGENHEVTDLRPLGVPRSPRRVTRQVPYR